MKDEAKGNRNKPVRQLLSFEVVKIAGQVGCLTFVIIMAALAVGLTLDRTFDTLPLFLILFMVGSAPVTFFTILWVVKRSTSNLTEG